MSSELRTYYETWAEQNLTISNRSGDEFDVLCPVHGESNASMRVNVEKGVLYCHGCGIRGTLRSLARRMNVPFVQGRETDMTVLRSKLSALKGQQSSTTPIEPITVWTEQMLTRFRRMPTTYWTDPPPRGRGYTQTTVDAFDLGYDPLEAHAIIPIRNIHGEILGVTRRNLASSRREYRDPRGFKKGENLFASWLVRESTDAYAVMMEGPLDAAKGWQAGHPSMAQYGSKLTPAQIRLLKQLGLTCLIFAYDNDRAGEEAWRYACGYREVLLPVTGKVKKIYLPENDVRKFFIVKRVEYTSGVKDPGAMNDADLNKMICAARYVR